MVIELNNGVVGGWTLPAKPCHSSPATVYCRPHSAFLCLACDARIHKVGGTRHERVLLCEVCQQALAAVTCKADAASLCVTCDADIHSANPLSQRHERVPIDPFFAYDDVDTDSLLIPDPDANVFLPVMDDPFLDFNYPKSADSKAQRRDFSDSVVPVQTKPFVAPSINHLSSDVNCFNLDLCRSKLSSLSYPSHSLSQTVSSSSFDAGVVPDGNSNSVSDTSYPVEPTQATQLSGMEREARVMRYREKRKKRKFEKTIRYASRKAYAETRPRIKGRFAKRTESESYLGLGDCQYGVVPSFHFAA